MHSTQEQDGTLTQGTPALLKTATCALLHHDSVARASSLYILQDRSIPRDEVCPIGRPAHVSMQPAQRGIELVEGGRVVGPHGILQIRHRSNIGTSFDAATLEPGHHGRKGGLLVSQTYRQVHEVTQLAGRL